jgi:glutamate-1-semialdehyde 2,1-aminomutase
MESVAPMGAVYQAGTLSGNPLAMRAGIETLKVLSDEGFYEALNRRGMDLADGIREALAHSGVTGQAQRAGSLLTLFFSGAPVHDYKGAAGSDTARFAKFFGEMLRRGVLLPPSQFEALFVSAAHSDQDIAATLQACFESLAAVASHP